MNVSVLSSPWWWWRQRLAKCKYVSMLQRMPIALSTTTKMKNDKKKGRRCTVSEDLIIWEWVGLHGFLQKVCLNLRSPTSRLQHYHNPIHAFNNCTKFEVDWRGTCHKYSFQFQLFKAAVTLTTNEGHCHLKWFKWIKSSNYCTTMPSLIVFFFLSFNHCSVKNCHAWMAGLNTSLHRLQFFQTS